jgi:hypothetical protein
VLIALLLAATFIALVCGLPLLLGFGDLLIAALIIWFIIKMFRNKKKK